MCLRYSLLSYESMRSSLENCIRLANLCEQNAYFNHYGFYHNAWRKDGTAKNRKSGKFSPRYIAGSRWMDEAFDKSKDKAYRIMEEELLKEFNKK